MLWVLVLWKRPSLDEYHDSDLINSRFQIFFSNWFLQPQTWRPTCPVYLLKLRKLKNDTYTVTENICDLKLISRSFKTYGHRSHLKICWVRCVFFAIVMRICSGITVHCAGVIPEKVYINSPWGWFLWKQASCVIFLQHYNGHSSMEWRLTCERSLIGECDPRPTQADA